MKPLPEHPLFQKLKRFDTDTEGQDPTPVPTASARPAPPSRVPTRASALPTVNVVSPPPAPEPAPVPSRVRIPYREMLMGESGYRDETTTRVSVRRGHSDPSHSPHGRRYFWVQR